MKKLDKQLGRAEFTKEELKQINKDIDLLIKTKFTENERAILREINQEKEVDRQERVKKLDIEAKPILEGLQKLGLKIDRFNSLTSSKVANHPDVIPMLLEHMKSPYFDGVRSIIANALAVKEAYGAWEIFVEEYRNAPQGLGISVKGDTEELSLSYKDSLANTLCDLFRNECLEEYLELLQDKKNGSSRILLLAPLRSRYKKNPIIKEALFELKADSDLVKEITSWKINWM